MYFFSSYLINPRPWPLISALNRFSFLRRLVLLFFLKNLFIFFFRFFCLLISSLQWWRDVIRETSFQGNHSSNTIFNLKFRFILFIIRELIFFFRFFWAFFHIRLSPDIEIGEIWPPISIYLFNPFQIPLLNTIILLSSGFSITWRHHNLLNNKFLETIFSLLITIFLGFYFTFLQRFEYFYAPFSISDSVVGSTFFITTGFHGIHVIIGSLFLLYNFYRIYFFHLRNSHHLRFEFASWYWHFVDIIWLFLFTFIYWWVF